MQFRHRSSRSGGAVRRSKRGTSDSTYVSSSKSRGR